MDSSGQTSGHRNCDYPGDDDVAEERPVDGLFGADAAGEDDGADFAVGCWDRKIAQGGYEHRHGTREFNDEPTKHRNKGIWDYNEAETGHGK